MECKARLDEPGFLFVATDAVARTRPRSHHLYCATREDGDGNDGHERATPPRVFERKRANMRLHPMFENTTYQQSSSLWGYPLEKTGEQRAEFGGKSPQFAAKRVAIA